MAYTHHDLNDRERRVLALLGGDCPCPVDHGPADDDELEPLTRIADIDPTARAQLVDALERRAHRRRT